MVWLGEHCGENGRNYEKGVGRDEGVWAWGRIILYGMVWEGMWLVHVQYFVNKLILYIIYIYIYVYICIHVNLMYIYSYTYIYM